MVRWTLPLAALPALALAPDAGAHAPHDVVTELALSPSFAVDGTLFASVTLTDNSLFVRSTDAGRSWSYIATPMADTEPVAFAFSPDFLADRTAFAASPVTGLWRTTDGGDTWQPANAGLTTPIVRDAAVSPLFAADRRVLAATSDGIFLSLDAGDTWMPASAGLVEPAIKGVAMALDQAGGLLCFAVAKTFHRSFDGGFTWLPTGQFGKSAESLAIAPDGSAELVVLVSFGRFGEGVALSTDGGEHFQAANDGLTDLFVEEVAIADDGTLFAVTDTAGCFRSAGPGAPWQLVIEGFEEPSELTAVHNTEVVPSPAFGADRTVFVGAYEGLYRSFDGGDAWRQLDVYSQRLNRRFVFSPQFATDSQILLGNYGGSVFHYLEAPSGPVPPAPGGPAAAAGPVAGQLPGAGPAPGSAGGAPSLLPAFAWEARGTNLTAPWSSVLVATPGELGQRTVAYGYTILRLSTDEGLTWGPAAMPPAVDVVRALGFSPQFSRDGVAFLGSGEDGSYRSSDGCQSWVAMPGLPPALATTAIGVSPGFPGDGTVFYASRNVGVFRSVNAGLDWAPADAGLPGGAIKALGLSPDFVDDRFVVAGHDALGLWVSSDAGATWDEANAGLPEGPRDVESLALSPGFAQDRTLFVALKHQGVWRSTDAALTWQPTGPGLPAPPVELAISPTFALDRTVVVGTFAATLLSRDAGASWQPLPGYVRADDSHPAVRYEGAWSQVADSAQFIGFLTTTSSPQDVTELEFFGRRIAWHAHRAPDGAVAEVQVDDQPPQLVDTWSETPEPQAEVFSLTFPEAGWHVIRVTHGGQARPGSRGLWLRSDGFAYAW